MLKVPNGELNSQQLRFLGDSIAPYGKDGCADITTRANIQLRGVTLDKADGIYHGLQEVGLSSVMTGMDNVRNITGSPLAGIDPHELIDTRPFADEINKQHTNSGKGNTELANLPRKLNISLSSTRDDFPHSHINDVAFEAVYDKQTDQVGFNVIVGGYFSVKRVATSIPLNCFVTQEQVVSFAINLLRVFRDYGPRGDRQKTRLMWLVEEWGEEKFKEKLAEYMGIEKLRDAVEIKHEGQWKRRDLLGVHPQKQNEYMWVGVQVPVGRLETQDFYDLADIVDKYGDKTLRLTPDQKIVIPFVKQELVEDMLKEPLFRKFEVKPGILVANLVSCTGAQFCGLALIETKNRALQYAEKLQDELEFEKPVRIHWTGCPNSCGQAQVGDIGIMGGPAKLNGKAVEGVRIFTGGQIGEAPKLASEFEKGVPVQEDILIPHLKKILIEQFGAKPKS